MPHYTLTHPSASATRDIMEHAVTRHGNIRVYNYEPARLYVEADKSAIESFQKSYTSWIVREEPKLDPQDIRPAPAQDPASERAARKKEWRRLGLS